MHTDILTKKEAIQLGIIGNDGLGFIKPQTAFKNITEQLLAEIKKGNLVWRKGWRSGVVVKGKTYGAQNYETQRPYTGGNAFFINMQNLLNGTDYRFFLTHKQIKERGASLKQGAKPFPVSVFIKNAITKTVNRGGEKIDVTTEETGVIWYYVYPIDLVDGLKEIKRKTHKPDTFNEIIVSDAETIVSNMPKAPQIKHGGDKAFYTPSLDYVQMPHKKAFSVQQEYYSVLFHELIHSTGSKKRLNRDMSGKFGDKSYASEELIAEIGAAFLCGVCEIDYYTINNSAAYLKGWSKTVAKEIEEDSNFLKRTVFKAVRAANFIIGKTLEKHGVIKKDVATIPVKKINPLLSDYPKGLQKFIDIAYNNSVADALFKVTKIKGVKQDVSTFFSENYNPDGKLSKSDSFVKFYNDVQEIKDKKNSIKIGKTSPDKNIKATAQQAISDLLTLPNFRFTKFSLSIFYNVFKNSDTVENLKNKIAAKLFEDKMYDLFEELDVDYTEKIKKATLNEEGKELIEKIKSRLETLKAKKSGTDLFPDLSGITDAVLIFINAFLATHDKTVTKEDLAYILATFQTAIKSGAIKAKHPLATIANQTQDKLAKLINTLKPKQKVKLHISNKAAIENKIMGLHGLGFFNVIAATVVGEIAKHVTHKHLNKNKPNVPALNGIEGFTRADKSPEVKAPDTYRLNGELGKLLGNIQPYKYSIVLTGDPHAGKTEFVMQLANGFSEIGKTVGAFMLEQGGLESKDTREAKDRNVTVKNQQNVFFTGEAAKGIDTVKECANKFNVIIVDSWQKLGIPSTKFDSLRHEFPNTIFIVIFQQNGEGGTRGGVVADYDTPVLLKVHKVDATFKNNYVEVKKNRGNPETLSLHYMVKAKKTVNAN